MIGFRVALWGCSVETFFLRGRACVEMEDYDRGESGTVKYMTFNSSCSYAGVANLLSFYGIDTDDRTIALEMGLPFFFDCEDGCYSSGPMLQSGSTST